MRRQNIDDRREVLKQILSGTITPDVAREKLRAQKPFDLHAAVYEFCDGDDVIMSCLFSNKYPKHP